MHSYCKYFSYKLLVRGHGNEAEVAIDKYISKADHPQDNLFMKLMKRW